MAAVACIYARRGWRTSQRRSGTVACIHACRGRGWRGSRLSNEDDRLERKREQKRRSRVRVAARKVLQEADHGMARGALTFGCECEECSGYRRMRQWLRSCGSVYYDVDDDEGRDCVLPAGHVEEHSFG